MRLIVCGRHRLSDLSAPTVTHMISIGDVEDDLESLRLKHLLPNAQLCLRFRDKNSPDKPNAPDDSSIRPLFNWLEQTGDIQELMIHCGAGMSRSPAIAQLTMCYLDPETDPFDHMLMVESRSDYKHIWPNPLVIQIGDGLMSSNGAIVGAVDQWRATQS